MDSAPLGRPATCNLVSSLCLRKARSRSSRKFSRGLFRALLFVFLGRRRLLRPPLRCRFRPTHRRMRMRRRTANIVMALFRYRVCTGLLMKLIESKPLTLRDRLVRRVSVRLMVSSTGFIAKLINDRRRLNRVVILRRVRVRMCC